MMENYLLNYFLRILVTELEYSGKYPSKTQKASLKDLKCGAGEV
jgi:hypothetical protein